MLLFPLTLARGAPDLAAASIYAAFNIADSAGAWLGGPVAVGSSSAALRREAGIRALSHGWRVELSRRRRTRSRH